VRIRNSICTWAYCTLNGLILNLISFVRINNHSICVVIIRKIKMKLFRFVNNIFLFLTIFFPVMFTHVQAEPFNQADMNKIVLDDLSYKTVFRQLYSKKMNQIFLDDEAAIKLPHVGMKIGKDEYVALFHPIQLYKNAQNKNRYLIMIEFLEVNNGQVSNCHGCSTDADLYIFEKLENLSYRLVSKTESSTNFGGSWGKSALDIAKIAKSIKKVSTTDVGAFYEESGMHHGQKNTDLRLLLLFEDQYINVFDIAQISYDNNDDYGKDSPLAYSFKGKYKIKPDQSLTKLYPIQIVFSGFNNAGDNSEKIVKYNVINDYTFDPESSTYKLISTKPY